jgi:glycolate oxidase
VPTATPPQARPTTAPLDWGRFARLCRAILPTRAVVSAPQELLSYDCDGLTLHRHAPPLVVLPENRDQVAALVSLCAREGVPFIARGSGTGLSGGALAEQEALVIATSRMRRILAVDLANRTVTVEPGVINSWVTRAVAGDGF